MMNNAVMMTQCSVICPSLGEETCLPVPHCQVIPIISPASRRQLRGRRRRLLIRVKYLPSFFRLWRFTAAGAEWNV